MANEEFRTRFRRDFNQPDVPIHRTKPVAQPPQPQIQSVPEVKKAIKPKKQRHKTNRRWPKVLLITVISLVISGLVFGGLLYFNSQHKKKEKTSLFGQRISEQISLPIYFPQNLPSGYTYNNDAKVIQTNVLFFTITSPTGEKFFVTQQALPDKFDFSVFRSKFLNPDTFDTDSGSVISGQVGNSFISSIRTKQNSWIIINAPTAKKGDQLESVTRSFVPAKQED